MQFAEKRGKDINYDNFIRASGILSLPNKKQLVET